MEFYKNKFGENEPFDKECVTKPVMCYEYLDCFEVLKEKKFPSREKFFSSLTNETVSQEDWERGSLFYEKLGCKNLMSYVNFYLATDIVWLTDACESFRDMTMEYYGLDALGHYITLASFSLDAALYTTRTKIELVEDINIINFLTLDIQRKASTRKRVKKP